MNFSQRSPNILILNRRNTFLKQLNKNTAIGAYKNIIKCARVHVFNLCFSDTQGTFLFETMTKRAVRYVKTVSL